MAYDNNMTGVLFRNAEKDSAHPNWPDHKGQCEINGEEFWVSAWVKTAGQNSKNPGSKFFSLAFTAKEAQGPMTGKSEQQKDPDSGFDDIPF